MTTNFRVKIGEVVQLTFIRRLGIPKRNGISQLQKVLPVSQFSLPSSMTSYTVHLTNKIGLKLTNKYSLKHYNTCVVLHALR